MTLITLLLCILLQRYLGCGGWMPVSWFKHYLSLWGPLNIRLHAWLQIVVAVVPILIMLAILSTVLGEHYYGLLRLLLNLAVLLVCMNATSMRHELAPFFAAMEQKNFAVAAKEIMRFANLYELPKEVRENHAQLSRVATKAIFTRSYERIFVQIFWYVIFGVYGVGFYYMVTILCQLEHSKHIAKLKVWLDWIPLRLVAISFALMGHFVSEFAFCRKHLSLNLKAESEFFRHIGLAALRVDPYDATKSTSEENHAAIALVNRALMLWIVIVAVFTLGALLA